MSTEITAVTRCVLNGSLTRTTVSRSCVKLRS